MKRLSEIISPIIKESGLEEGIRLDIIKRRWNELFGPPLCLHLYPISMRDGELIVNVDSTLWLQEASLQKKNILKNLTPFGLKDVRFRLGRVFRGREARQEKEEKGHKKPLSPDSLRYIAEVISPIKDYELKETIRTVMEKSFSRTQGSDSC